MSLELKFKSYVSIDGTRLVFQEITGIYDLATNTTGWGTPNEEIATATAATLEVLLPNTDEDDIVVLDVLAQFPSSDTSKAVEFSMADFGGEEGDIFPDGVYELIYTVIANENTYSTSKYVFGYSQVKCCVEKMFGNLNPYDCSGGCLEAAEEALVVWSYYKTLLANAECGNVTKANEMLAFVNKLCSGTGNCTNCQ